MNGGKYKEARILEKAIRAKRETNREKTIRRLKEVT
jgi:hypothetical protein